MLEFVVFFVMIRRPPRSKRTVTRFPYTMLSRLWDRVVAALPAGTHVVAPDHRGHGRSFRPATLADWGANADVLLPLVARFAGRPLVGCGHSIGGSVLTRLSAESPDAFGHLGLIDPAHIAPALYGGADA